VRSVVGKPSNRRSSGDAAEPSRKVNRPGLGVRCYFASTTQADEVYAALVAAGLIDAASRVTRATARQRVKLQMALDVAA
jgi:phage head maturation protease